jgi:predicted nucleic acid-binding protein
MLAEALDSGVITRPNAAALKPKRDAIKGLHRYWEMAAQIFHANLLVIGSDEARHRSAQEVRSEHGLLTNDSLIVAAAFEYGIRSLATHDSDFDRISDLTVYSPTDLP